MASKKTKFPAAQPRAAKRRAGAAGVEATPLAIRATGIKVSRQLDALIRERLARGLGKFADRIERITVRFEDVNGPRGGVDVECRTKVVLSGMPSVLVSASGATAEEAFARVAPSVTRTVRKTLDKAGSAARPRAARRKPTRRASELPPDPGSFIGRRVGRSSANLRAALERPEKQRRDLPVDTAAPGVSASDRKAGGTSTARRNTLARAPRATAALEDSRQDRPSRKSTRRSANRARSATNIQKRVIAETSSPRTRATRKKN